MEIGTCPRCATPYTSSEVTGFGVLRGRPARQGGPRVEYSCLSCGTLIRLVAHGGGRYTPPGQPPPPAIPPAARAAPWMQGKGPGQGPRATQDRPPPGRGPDPAPEPEPEPYRVPPPEPERAPEGPLDAAGALALLGLEPAADRAAIERAFRERSLACHPDKVAHLDPDFQALAERKFRRLQQAYDLLID